jgi:hypothetical protein
MLQTTSTMRGHVMKATDRSRALGSIMGGALRRIPPQTDISLG